MTGARWRGNTNPAGMGFAAYGPDGKLRFRLFAGQADRADPAHFWLPYDLAGETGTIDGWLEAGDRIRLQVRDGPLAATAATTTR